MFKKYLPYIVLFLSVFVLFLTNYKPGTWLSGWDTLHPEFNFGLNIRRELFAGWQEYQGLGSVGGLMIAADLPRVLFLWVLSFVLPLSLLRYVFTFLMLFLGASGVYYLLHKVIFKGENYLAKRIIGISSSLYYLLNIGTVQIFYVPFDPYVVFYGFLPWLIALFLKTAENPTKKNLLIFTLVNFCAVPQGYAPTIFVVYVAVLGLIGLIQTLKEKSLRIGKRFVYLLFLIFAINSFWLFNFSYFVGTNVNSSVKSHMGFMSTQDIYLQNNKFGDIANVVQLKSFLFNFTDTDITGRYGYMMAVWENY